MKYIGIMSGTSLDGIDAVICEFSADNQVQLIAKCSLPFEPQLQADLQKLQSLRWKCLDAASVKIADKQRLSCLEASVSDLESQVVTLQQSHMELTEKCHVSTSTMDSIKQRNDKYGVSLKSILSLCEILSTNSSDASRPTSFSSQTCLAATVSSPR